MNKITEQIRDWFLLSRAPFLSVGILPFILGTLMAYRITGDSNLPVFWMGFTVIILILLATYYNGEVHDIAEDRLSAKEGKTIFAGGSQVLVKKKICPTMVERAAYAALFIAVAIVIGMYFFYNTGLWTLLLAFSGIISGFFYSKPPFRWVKRGVGEVLIAYSYGWLAIAFGFYLQTQEFNLLVLWVSLPVALTIFNVILINEFLDYVADSKTGKKNLLVRIGRARGALVYMFSAIGALAAFYYSLGQGVPFEAAFVYVLVVVLTVVAVSMVIAKKYESRSSLQIICAITLVINLVTTGSYIIGFIVQ
jgi:1,4-dihydroxy-2-naphthoate polyprenyltransferase